MFEWSETFVASSRNRICVFFLNVFDYCDVSLMYLWGDNRTPMFRIMLVQPTAPNINDVPVKIT